MTTDWSPPLAPLLDPPTLDLPVQRGPLPPAPFPPAPPFLPAPPFPPAQALPAPAPQRPRRGWAMGIAAMLGLVLGGGAVAAVLGTGLLGGSAPADGAVPAPAAVPATFAVSGSLTLSDTSSYGPSIDVTGGSCNGDGGYSDIRTGAGITVADAAGTIVAIGSLGPGRASSSMSCTFSFTVSQVPTGSDFYLIEVSHRGAVTYRGDDLRRSGASLSLGT
jgi:hypothetical protein